MKIQGPVLTYSEIKAFASWAQTQFAEAQLQEIWTNGEQIVFQFYKFKELYLLISLQPQQPRVAVFKERPKVEKKSKPVTLFLNSHARNLRWDKMWTQEDSGRVLFLALTAKDKDCEIEIHLIPRNVNLLARSGDKKIAWEKPRELPTSQNQETEDSKPLDVDWWTASEQWWHERLKPAATKSAVGVAKKQDPRTRAVEKKQKALETLQAQLEKGEARKYQELGELLKSSAAIPEEYQELYNKKLSVVENMQKAFTKAKELARKRQGVLDRVEILKKEIIKLEKDIKAHPTLDFSTAQSPPPSTATRLLEKSNSKGRKKVFADGIEAVLGKSAGDNLSILRQAQAWHLWMHLKDDPGAHAIILRGRNQNVPPQVIEEVAEWVRSASSGSKNLGHGVRYEVIVVECRHVRPIKGDRLGRVTYHHPQVFSFASK
jgi:predicted ribosome quality control (RQC) complex YloA/Tae2 family protein